MNKLELNNANELVIFGATGDLSRRKLFPALYQLELSGLLSADLRIFCVARNDFDQNAFIKLLTKNLQDFVIEPLDKKALIRLQQRFFYQPLDINILENFSVLADNINLTNQVRIFYFSTPPALYEKICDGLAYANLITPADRIIMEKPIGNCLASSKIINDQVSRYFNENQIYRIDHYLGKETVLNLLVLRFANSLFTTNWDHNCIDHIQITVAESVGIEGRFDFYDEAGQLRDMVQNHLLQILSLLAMEPPADLSADSIRDEKLKVLKALRPINRFNVKEKTVRGQYTGGFLNGRPVPGYLEEGINTKSNTETFVAIKAEIDNWRWAGVPFYLRTGKRMPLKHSEIVIHFKHQPHNIFNESYAQLPANKLTIRLQPDEGVELQVMNKIPGIASQLHIHENKLDLSFSEAYVDTRVVDAYERLILEVLSGNQSLFVRRDEVEQAWHWIDGIIDAWEITNDKPKPYAAGSWGPVAAIALIARDDRQWDE
jgi:glucose-6-phosphate 1-dehydrogenase